MYQNSFQNHVCFMMGNVSSHFLQNCMGIVYTVYMEGLGVSMETLIGNMVGYVQVPPPGGPQVSATFAIQRLPLFHFHIFLCNLCLLKVNSCIKCLLVFIFTFICFIPFICL